jgi:ADP-dependent NAD(P)H-hydrate dehydratase
MLDPDAAASLALALEVPRARVIDAAALCALAAPPGPNAVLTPHDGEMAKLMRVEPAEVDADRPRIARDAARRFDAVVALKGGETIVAAPDGRRWRYRDGRVGLATSGSGDTLAGLVGGLLARGADPVTATLWAVHLHGEAGNRLPPLGFLARELLDQIPLLLAERS